MQPLAKGQVPVWLAPQIERVGSLEPARVAIGGIDHCKDTLAFTQRLSPQGVFFGHDSGDAVARAIESQELLYRRGDDRWILLQSQKLVGMLQQGNDGTAKQVGGCLMTAK